MDFSRQVELRRGSEAQVAYIPDRFAITGKVLRIDGCGNGWVVTAVYNRRPSAEVNAHSRDFMKQRKASDI